MLYYMKNTYLSKYRRKFLKLITSSILSILCHWQQCIHLYIFIIVVCITSLISYHKSFGLLYNLKYIVSKSPSIIPKRNSLISKQKQEQKQAYEWLDRLWKNSKNYSNIISNQTEQSRFYDFIDMKNMNSSPSYYRLFEKPKQITLITNRSQTSDQILISILYSRQDVDHLDGKFYIGQILYELLKTYHSRFIITLCENNNTSDKVSDSITLIRRLVPVFIVDSIHPGQINNMYEQEKQAHIQCIMANFQSFPNINYFLLLQDDAQPIDDYFYLRLLSLIDDRIKQQWPLNGYRQQPAFIKMYHPRWLIDYLHPSFYIIVQLIATSLFLTLLGASCFYLFQTIRQVCQYIIRHFN